jgi:cytochrome c-type biogenesis protein CcmH/NrfG
MVSRGSLLSAQHLNAEADAAFEEAIARSPNLADAFYWYGRHAYGAGDHRKAVALFERTMELDPTTTRRADC